MPFVLELATAMRARLREGPGWADGLRQQLLLAGVLWMHTDTVAHAHMHACMLV